MNVPANDIMRSPWLWDKEPFQIADNMYYVGNKDVSCHLFDTGEGLLLLDASYPQASYQLLESVRALGFDPHDIKWILHSHGHIDHFGCTRMLTEKFGCKTYFPELDLPLLDEKRELNWHEEFGIPYEPPYDLYFKPDVLMKPGDVLTFGNTTVECYAAGGHTPGTMCLRFLLPGGLVAAMHGGVGVNTLSSAYSKKRGIGRVWRDTFIRDVNNLVGLKVDIVLGNHPDQSGTFKKQAGMTADCNPFIDPAEWDRLMTTLQKRWQRLEEEDPIQG
ncbi:MAG: MBL fold metallo-hydrolase [Oscillospiraceae bacterium]|nr:MBL fold metallo-hydrolase [Oscillospiraceae bacterium]